MAVDSESVYLVMLASEIPMYVTAPEHSLFQLFQ